MLYYNTANCPPGGWGSGLCRAGNLVSDFGSTFACSAIYSGYTDCILSTGGKMRWRERKY